MELPLRSILQPQVAFKNQFVVLDKRAALEWEPRKEATEKGDKQLEIILPIIVRILLNYMRPL